MKIYTKSGDKGESGLFGGVRKRKDEPVFWLIGTLDELNSLLGLSQSSLKMMNLIKDNDLINYLELIKKDLFDFGAEVVALESEIDFPQKISQERITALENQIDQWTVILPEIRGFILPGGNYAGSILHQARAICRRAEREFVGWVYEKNCREELYMYLNRLSDWLFTAARYVVYIEEYNNEDNNKTG